MDTLKHHLKNAHNNWVYSMINYNNNRIISCSFDDTIKVWNINQMVEEYCITIKDNYTMCMALISSNSLIAGLNNGNMNEYDLVNKILIRTIITGHTDCIWKLCILSEGLLLTGSSDSSAKIIDIKGETCLKTFKQNDIILSVVVLRDSRIIIGGQEKKLTFII